MFRIWIPLYIQYNLAFIFDNRKRIVVSIMYRVKQFRLVFNLFRGVNVLNRNLVELQAVWILLILSIFQFYWMFLNYCIYKEWMIYWICKTYFRFFYFWKRFYSIFMDNYLNNISSRIVFVVDIKLRSYK